MKETVETRLLSKIDELIELEKIMQTLDPKDSAHEHQFQKYQAKQEKVIVEMKDLENLLSKSTLEKFTDDQTDSFRVKIFEKLKLLESIADKKSSSKA